jgi:hypothetical protein
VRLDGLEYLVFSKRLDYLGVLRRKGHHTPFACSLMYLKQSIPKNNPLARGLLRIR